MTRLSENTMVPSISGYSSFRFVPFTAYCRIIPNRAFGRRFEEVRDREKIADLVEDCIRTFMDVDVDTTDVYAEDAAMAKPVANTPQFGNYTARLTVVGNARLPSGMFPKAPNGQTTVVNCGRVLTGVGCTNAASATQSSFANMVAYGLKLGLESICGGSEPLFTVYKIDVAGIIYGLDGRTFPQAP